MTDMFLMYSGLWQTHWCWHFLRDYLREPFENLHDANLHLALAYMPVPVPSECNKRVLNKVECPVVGC